MAKTSTSFKPGQSGNPAGRPRGLTAREAVRRSLAVAVEGGLTRLDAWAEELVTAAVTPEDKLDLLRWLEGASPTADSAAMERIEEMLDEIESRMQAMGEQA